MEEKEREEDLVVNQHHVYLLIEKYINRYNDHPSTHRPINGLNMFIIINILSIAHIILSILRWYHRPLLPILSMLHTPLNEDFQRQVSSYLPHHIHPLNINKSIFTHHHNTKHFIKITSEKVHQKAAWMKSYQTPSLKQPRVAVFPLDVSESMEVYLQRCWVQLVWHVF